MLTKTELAIDPAWVTVILCGYPLVYLSITRLIHNQGPTKISSALLISIAMLACIALSFAPDSHENMFAAGEVAFIMAIGGILEDKTVERAKKGLKKLISLVPNEARKIMGGTEELVPVERVQKEDLLRVLPGEAIPVDGEIIEGTTSVDQSVMTGESLPVDKKPGDSVFCGTINRFGAIDIKATKVGEDSSLQKLIRMVQEAEHNKALMQRIVDKWAAWLVPIALLIAVITYFATKDIIRAVTILVVFCPCALALATPTSIMAAIGQATKYGVIIKSGEALEQMGKVNCIAFDKTGTLTHGNLVVSDVFPLKSTLTEADLLAITAAAESRSEHPLAQAIVHRAKEEGMPLREVSDFYMMPGKGICAGLHIGGAPEAETLYCGNAAWLEENGIPVKQEAREVLEGFRKQGKATIAVASREAVLGIIALSDTLRPEAAKMAGELKAMNTETVLLTGDHAQTAQYFARQAGIENIHAELLPAQKVERLQSMQQHGKVVCMLGDGVNDAPALKVADVGVAMGGMGSDIAVEAADIALVGDDISKIPYLKRLSVATVKLIKLNITLSMVINFAAIILSVLALLNPVTGALVHNVGSVLVVLNAALLYDRKYA